MIFFHTSPRPVSPAGKNKWLAILRSGMLLLLLWHTSSLHAQTGETVLLPDGGLETPYGAVIGGTQTTTAITAWSTGAAVTTKAPRGAETSRSFRNLIRLYLQEESITQVLNDFTATVSLQVEYKKLYTDASYQMVTCSLTLHYKNGESQLSDANNYGIFEGAEEVKVTVTAINFPTASGGIDYRNLLRLENIVYAIRYYTISSSPFTIGTATQPAADMLRVSWLPPSNGGHNAIQLEWAWLENELEPNYHISNAFTTASKENLLSGGATRVELGHTAAQYNIPLLYDGAGKLHYRVRGISIQSSGTRIAGPWSAIQSFAFSGHEPNLNWQVTTSFAEEGKHKTVVQYYDGSLRARQTVTKDNASQNTVTAETLYDREGRPAIQVLPTPGISNLIAYQRNLHQFNSPDAGIAAQANGQNHADYFDYYFTGSSTPTLKTEVNGSAAQYYSPANPQASGAAKYIPDAEGYPYTVTRYTPDATGRVLSQSGVGAAFKMGSGHETKYYYGSPKQEELDALFGTEAGDKSHYFKNMVQDANGQMSVSYTDMLGRTIATALAGEAPANLSPLAVSNATYYPNQHHTAPITVSLLDSNTNVVKGNAIESVSTLLVPYNTIYNFSYTLTPEKLSVPVCSTTVPTCYECLYDLELAIIDESGDRDAPVVLKRFNNLGVDINGDCSRPVPLFQNLDDLAAARQSTISFATTLPAGSYTIRKTLTLSESSLATFRANYLDKTNCSFNMSFLVDSVYQSIKAITQCDVPPPVNPEQSSCTSCNTALGTAAAYRTAYLARIGFIGTPGAALEAEIAAAYAAAKKSCDLLCGSTPLETVSKREMMLADMMPFTGQYAKEAVSGSVAQQYNIFSTVNATTQPFYKKPKKADGTAAGDYLTEQGQADLSIKELLPAISPQDFSKLYKHKWAEALLPYHPEFERLKLAESPALVNCYKWEQTFNSISTWSAAEAGGYIFTSEAMLAAKDPFFALANSSSYKAEMNSYITNVYMPTAGISIWQSAYLAAICPTSSASSECRNNSMAKIPPYYSLSATQKDALWNSFKDIYLQARGSLMDKYIAAQKPLTGSTHATLLSQQYILHFPADHNERVKQAQNNSTDGSNWNFWNTASAGGGMPNLPTGWNTGGPEKADNAGRCDAYMDSWKQALAGCPALQAHPQSAAILQSLAVRMAAICLKGSDKANPQGASTVAPATPNDGSFRSFEALVQHVLDSLGIAKTDRCNPFVIEYPKAYGMGRKPAPTVVSVIESCNCTRYSEMKQEVWQAGKNPGILSSFNEYLLAQYGDTISESLFDALIRCSELSSPVNQQCTTIYTPIYSACGKSPCGQGGSGSGGGEIPEMQAMTSSPQMLSMQNGEVVAMTTTTKELIYPDYPPDDCYYYDPYLGICTGPGNCPYNYEWNYGLNKCVPVVPYCWYTCPVTTCTYTYTKTITLAAPAALPDFMQCGFTPVQQCYTCTDIKTQVDNFKAWFPAPYNAPPYSGSTPIDATQTAYLENMARYINYKTGMSYEWRDYMKAIDSAGCNLDAGGTRQVLCRNNKPISDTTGIFVKEDPCQASYDMALHIAQQLYELRWKRRFAEFEQQYRAKCMAADKLETFTVSYVPKEYHYTLYYYDQAGNLLKTVPPAGVRPDYSATFLDQVKASRKAGTAKTPLHVLTTQYRYNSLNQVVSQVNNDAGLTKFWYDRLGRLVISQNRKQQDATQYSYTLYDVLGRITEVGQAKQATVMNQLISQNDASLANWLGAATVRDQITQTVYDQAYTPATPDPEVAAGMEQRHLRGRVSYTLVKNQYTDAGHSAATFYSYDIHGNVAELLQDYRGVAGLPAASRFKRMSYRYDLISGKVNEVAYQPGAADAFYHRYAYDAENRLTAVYTSRDKAYWERDAAYSYYRHGPLARTVLGQLQVQGLDYAYTLQGWLKGVNGSSLNTGLEMGQDGHSTGSNSMVARDVFGFALHYYESGALKDYKPIGNSNPEAGVVNNDFKSLYNGNIAAMTVNNGGLKKGPVATTNALPLLYNYGYDQLNRIISMQAYKGLNEATNVWTPVAIEDYKEAVTYDANGNIRTYQRNGSPSIAGKQVVMDNLTYNYDASTNRLRLVTDNTSYSSYYSEDVDHQAGVYNYYYDYNGNLIGDVAEKITNINWTVYGKIASIVKNGATISYSYDAAGNRITKTAGGITTLYVRDASGNVMSVYELPAAEQLVQKELHLYGSSRIGIVKVDNEVVERTPLPGGGEMVIRKFTRGNKFFETTNHLGNVLATVTDRKLLQSSTEQAGINNGGCQPGTAVGELTVMQRGTASQFTARTAVYLEAGFETVDAVDELEVNTSNQQGSCVVLPPATISNGQAWYVADVVSATDYAPFGMALVGRSYSSEKYRYGFNGKENDNEVKGAGNQQDYGMRVYDPRLGRFLSVDPLTKIYPMLTPYQFASNRPIDGIDLDGLEYYSVHINRDLQDDGTEVFTVTGVEDHTKMTESQFGAIHGRSDVYNYKNYSKSFGSKGRGVLYIYTFTRKGKKYYDGNFTSFDVSQGNILSDTKRHGIWAGPGSLTKYGSGAGEDRKKNPYVMDDPTTSDAIFKPVDEGDYMAYLHDRAENQPDFKSHTEARWLEADITFIAQLELYVERAKDPNYKDEFTGRAPSKEAKTFADNAIKFFTGKIPLLLRPLAGKGEMPPKAKERGITMEEVRNRIDAQKAQLQKEGKKF